MGDVNMEELNTVRKLVDHLIDEVEGRGEPEPRTVTFSIRLTEPQVQLLENLADWFKMKKTPLAEVLLVQAMEEAAGRLAIREGRGDPQKALEFVGMLHRAPHPSPPGLVESLEGEE